MLSFDTFLKKMIIEKMIDLDREKHANEDPHAKKSAHTKKNPH